MVDSSSPSDVVEDGTMRMTRILQAEPTLIGGLAHHKDSRTSIIIILNKAIGDKNTAETIVRTITNIAAGR
jgi:hypothetical protein